MSPVVLLTLLALTVVLFGLCLLNTGATEAAPSAGHDDHGDDGHGDHGHGDHAAGHQAQSGPAGAQGHH